MLLHRIPHLIGTKGSIETLDATVRSSNFDVVPQTLRLSGNYNRHVLTINAPHPSSAWDEIAIEPTASQAEAESGDVISLQPVTIPLKATPNLLYRVRHKWVPLVILALALAANGVIAQWGLVKGNHALIILIGLVAIVASGAVLKIGE